MLLASCRVVGLEPLAQYYVPTLPFTSSHTLDKLGGRGRILTYESTGLQPEPLNTLVPDHKLSILKHTDDKFSPALSKTTHRHLYRRLGRYC